MQKITFIIHGKLKIDKLKKNISKVFKDFDLSFAITSKENGAIEATKQAIKKNADIIIICGGDGSINEVVNGYLKTETEKEIKFGILPMGTGNDFVKTLKVSNDLEKLKQSILQNQVAEVNIFKMKFTNLQNELESRFFINVSDIGIGGYVAETISKSSNFLGSNLTYFKAIVTSFLKYKKQKISLTSSTLNWQGSILSLCMANGKYFGSGLCIAPNANINDKKLQITILGDVSLLDYLKNIGNLKKSKFITHPEVQYTYVENCKISSLEKQECPIDMDGEFIGYTPIAVDLHKKRMKFLCKY